MATFSNSLTFSANPKAIALNNKLAPSPLTMPSSTYQYNVPKPNSAANIAYGGSPTVPSNQYASTPSPAFTPSTPVKAHTVNADGSNKTDFHAPTTPTPLIQPKKAATPTTPTVAPTKVLADTQTQPPAQPEAPTTAQPATAVPTQPTYANPLIQPAIDAQQRAVNINQALNQSVNDRTKQGIALPFVQGQQAALERDYGVQANAASQEAQNATTMAGFGQPQQYSLYSQPYNPLTDTYGGGGAGGAINRSVQASNVGSAGDFQTKIQQAQAAGSAADSNFNVLNSYASQAGIDGNSPILSGLQQKYGQIVGGADAPAVAGFKAQLQSLRSAYQQLTGGDPVAAIPDGVTPAQLQNIQQSLKSTVQNNVAGYNKQLSQLQGTTAQGGGGAYTSSSGKTYTLPY